MIRGRITEAAGTPLSMILPSTNPWGAQDCTREECITCNQGDEKRQDCRKRNIMYESACQLCKSDAKEDQKAGKSGLGHGVVLYVGESSRSMYERAKEHTADRMKKQGQPHDKALANQP